MKPKNKRLKMSNKWFRILLSIPLILILLLTLIINTVARMLDTTLDTYLGRGESYIVSADRSKDWDANYYTLNHKTWEEAKEAAYDIATQVQQEGTTLLKNKDILPLQAKTKVMPFGYAYLSPVYGQSTPGGSAKWVVDPTTPEQGLKDFVVDSSAIEVMENAGEPVGLNEAPGTIVAGEAGSILGGDSRIFEYDAAIYEGISPVDDTVGMVFISRAGQEGQDMKYDAYEDGTPHYLALSENEKNTIAEAKRITGRVVVVLVTSAPMELAPLQAGELEVDGILWYGHPGEKGFSVLSDILTGAVNPSGRTVDIYPTDFTKDPTYQGIGTFTYSNVDLEKAGFTGDELEVSKRTYTEYQEGVYMGYRYYETADFMDADFVYGSLDEQGGLTQLGAVSYPFGYGLSYTNFEQKLLAVTEDKGTVTARIKVTNTGSVSGKDVVQLYYTAPYTKLDMDYQIEKPVVNLIAFDKTKELAPNESQELILTFHKEDMASYSYKYENPNGTVGAYMLEEGDYIISLRENSNKVIETATIRQAETIWYDGSDENHIREVEKQAQSKLDEEGVPTSTLLNEGTEYVAASNQFQASSDYMNTDSIILSRRDWKGTQPKAAEDRTKEMSKEFSDLLGLEVTFDVENDPRLGNVEGSLVYSADMPTSGADNGLKLSDLRGLDYDDPKWEELLDQIDWEADKNGILMNFAGAAYATGAIESIGLPATEEYDGANGLKVKDTSKGISLNMQGYDMNRSASFGFPPLMAATYNEELMYQVGEALGQEALHHGINGWYAPGVNLHRSVFSGRVFEYYSEDPLLSGKVATQVIAGAGDQGLFSYIKHFVLNETDTGRDRLANFWADEQTMRELYMKPFELAVTNAKMTLKYISDDQGTVSERVVRATTGLMATQTSVGTLAGEANYNLLENVLRKEWGFRGVVVTDYWVWGKDNLRDLSLRSGSDTYLSNYMPNMWNLVDYDSATSRSVMRNAIHNLAYTVVNSNVMQGVAPGAVVKVKVSPWKYALYGADAIVIIIIGLGIYWMVRRTKDEKNNPGKYKRRAKKEKAA